MYQELRHTKSRIIFLYSWSAFLVLCILGLIWLHSVGDRRLVYFDILNGILIELIASTFVAGVLVILFVLLLSKHEDIYSEANVVDAAKSVQLHKEALQETDFWFHYGHIGRWVRTAAMPCLAKKTKSTGVPTTIKIVVLNPKDDDVISRYVTYRKGLGFQDDLIATIKQIKTEIYSTIVRAKYYTDIPERIQVNVYLVRDFSGFRNDVNSVCAFDTRIDSRLPVIYYPNKKSKARTNLYISKLSDFIERQEACEVVTNSDNEFRLTDLNDLDQISRYLEGTGLLVNAGSELLDEISKTAQIDNPDYV